MTDASSLAAKRVPGSRVRHIDCVRRDHRAWVDYYEKDVELAATTQLVQELEAQVREMLQIPDGKTVVMTEQRTRGLTTEQHAMCDELKEARLHRVRKQLLAEGAAMIVERRDLWDEAQSGLIADEAKRLPLQQVAKWPVMSEAQAVAFSLERPDLSAERAVLLNQERAFQAVILEAGAVHLLKEEGWARRYFEATCETCHVSQRVQRPLRCKTVGCQTVHGWSFRACVPDLDHIVSASGKRLQRDLYGVWRAMGGDAHSLSDPVG